MIRFIGLELQTFQLVRITDDIKCTDAVVRKLWNTRSESRPIMIALKIFSHRTASVQ